MVHVSNITKTEEQSYLFDILIDMFRGESLPVDWVHPPRYWPPSVAKEHSAITTESPGLDQNIRNVEKEKQACLLHNKARIIILGSPNLHPY